MFASEAPTAVVVAAREEGTQTSAEEVTAGGSSWTAGVAPPSAKVSVADASTGTEEWPAGGSSWTAGGPLPSPEVRPAVEETLQQEVDRLTGEHAELSRRIAEITGSNLPFVSSERPMSLSAVPDIINVDVLEEMPPLRSEVRLPLAISDDLIRLIGTISLGSIDDPTISDLPTFSPEELAEKAEEDEVRDDLAQAELDRLAALSLGPVLKKTTDVEN